jgi:MFS family permease
VSGIALTSATLTWTAGAWLQAHWVERIGTRRFIRMGFAIVALGVASTALVLLPGVPVAAAVVTWGVTGLGMGLAYSPLSLVVLRDAAGGQEGVATSGLQLSDTLGTAVGAGVAGAAVAAGDRAGLEPWVGLAVAFAIGAGAALLGAVAGRRLGSRVALRT